MTKIAELFAENLRRIRLEKNMTQEAIAERASLTVITIQNYESQRRWPSPDTIQRLAKALSVSEAELFKARPGSLKMKPAEVLMTVSEALGISFTKREGVDSAKRRRARTKKKK